MRIGARTFAHTLMPHAAARLLARSALLAATALSAAAACTHAPPKLGDNPATVLDSMRVGPRRPASSARDVVEKRVAGKRPPATLIAADSSWCTVSEREYHDTKIGDRVRCVWVAS